MKRKWLSVLVTCAVLAQVVPVYAANTNYSEEGPAQVEITALVADNFTVGIPTSLALTKDGTGYKGTFVKQAFGDIASSKKLKVTPTDQNPGTEGIQIKISSGEGQYKVEKYLTLTDEKTEYTTLELNGSTVLNDTEYDGVATEVSVSGELPAGSWMGTLTYTIALESAQ